MTRRDGSGNAEKIQVILDTHHDRRTGYGFGVTASDVRSDYHHSSDDEMRGRESQYDPVWAVATDAKRSADLARARRTRAAAIGGCGSSRVATRSAAGRASVTSSLRADKDAGGR